MSEIKNGLLDQYGKV